MTFDVKRVSEARYAGRVRETALNQERADDKERLAELEEFVRRHRKAPPREDSVELESPPATPAKSESPSPPAPAPKPAEPKEDHLDITV